MSGDLIIRPKPRLLLIGAFPSDGCPIIGGIVTSCRALLQSSFPDNFELALLDSTQLSNPPPRLAVRMLRAVARSIAFVSVFERRKPDAVLLFASAGGSIAEKGAMAWYARLRGVPALLFPRGGVLIDSCRRSRLRRLLVRFLLRGARMMLCQGTAWQRFAVCDMGFAESAAPVIPNWTATPDLLSLGRQRRPQRAGAEVRLLFVGWVEERKGIFELLEACRMLQGHGAYRLNVVGDGHAATAARDFVARHGMEKVVRFSGWLQGPALRDAYADADMLVLPSWAEGLPNAMIEGMAAKLAIVVSHVGNVPDVINDGREGLLVPPRDPDALSTALGKLIDHPRMRNELAESAFRKAEAEFGVERAVGRLTRAIAAATGRPMAPGEKGLA